MSFCAACSSGVLAHGAVFAQPLGGSAAAVAVGCCTLALPPLDPVASICAASVGRGGCVAHWQGPTQITPDVIVAAMRDHSCEPQIFIHANMHPNILCMQT